MTRGAAFAAALPLAAAAAVLAGFWPGLMTWDAAREYGMALGGPIDDWHPPAMIWLWRHLLGVAAGPGPMLAVQMALYGAGWALLAGSVARAGRAGTAIALGACAFMPIALALEGAVLKDSLMAGALLAAAGLLALGGRWRRAGAVALLLAAATLRFNAFLACLPLIWMALPDRWRGGWRAAMALTVSAVALVAATPIVNRLIGARASHVELSQILFDLGGITRFARVDAFPPVAGVDDPVRVDDGCYDPALWDAYAWWTAAPCPIGWANAGAILTRPGASPTGWWLGQIAQHPLAYAEHRVAHWNRNLHLWVAGGPVQIVPDQPRPNPYGFEVQPTVIASFAFTAATAHASLPFGWPAWWLAVAAGVLILAPTLPSRTVIAPLAASALLYGCGYLVLSVASDLRYHLWTMLAALAAAVLASGDLVTGPRPKRARLLAAAAPATLVTVAGLLARATLAG